MGKFQPNVVRVNQILKKSGVSAAAGAVGGRALSRAATNVVRRLSEMVDVSIASREDGDALLWDAASGLWIPGVAGGGGGGGGGFSGDWVAGAYPAGAMVAYGGILCAARVSTSAEPEARTVASSDVVGASWTRNSVASTATDEVTLIAGAGGDTASVVSNQTWSGWDGFAFHFNVQASGGDDMMHIGIVDATTAATAIGSGLEGVAGFNGIGLDIYNNRVVSIVAGAVGSNVSYDPETTGFEEWVLEVSLSGANWIVKVKRAAGATTVATFTVTKPVYTDFRIGIGAKTGGLSGTFKVKGTPYFGKPSVDWRRITALIDAV